MKIAIFENEWESVKVAFQAANLLHFNDSLKFQIFVSSQNFGDFKNITKYNIVLIDLDLSVNSDLDGFGVIKEINNVENHPPIIILTGSSSVKDKLKEHNLDEYKIITKPVDIDEISSNLKYYTEQQ